MPAPGAPAKGGGALHPRSLRPRTLRAKKTPRARGLQGDGAETRNRTADLLITNQLLYRLSYFGVDRALGVFYAWTQIPGAREYFIPAVELKGFFL